jgi:hypothetical protein
MKVGIMTAILAVGCGAAICIRISPIMKVRR